MSETVTLSLALCVVIVLVLLLNCWNVKKEKTASTDKPNRVASAESTKPGANPAHSDWGSGVKNTEFRNRNKDLTNLAGYDDYNAVSQYMSIEPEVYESHARYSSDMGRSTSGASLASVRDDSMDLVPVVGIRRPNYQAVYAGPGARQEHTETPDQMRKPVSYCLQ